MSRTKKTRPGEIRSLAATTGKSRRGAANIIARERAAQLRPATKTNEGGFIEALVFDVSGRECIGLVTFVPPGLPNGAPEPDEGLIMGGIPSLRDGRYLLLEPTGRLRHISAERTAGGGAFMVRFTAPDEWSRLRVVYASTERGRTLYARYEVSAVREPAKAIGHAFRVRSVTPGATAGSVIGFGWQAWRELFAKLDGAHPTLKRNALIDRDAVVQSRALESERVADGRARAHVPRARGMRGLGLLLTPEFLATYHEPVMDLGVEEVRFSTNSDGHVEGLYFKLPESAPQPNVDALSQRLRELWADEGIELMILNRRGDELWSWDEEDALLRREGEERRLHVEREALGRWVARTRSGLVAYGRTCGDARAKAILAAADEGR